MNNAGVNGPEFTALIEVIEQRRIYFNAVDAIIESGPQVLLRIGIQAQDGIVLQALAFIEVLDNIALFIQYQQAIEDGAESIIFALVSAISLSFMWFLRAVR